MMSLSFLRSTISSSLLILILLFILIVQIHSAKKVSSNRIRQVVIDNDIKKFDENRIIKTKQKNRVHKEEATMIPVVVNTWAFTDGADKAWQVLSDNGTALDAVEKGCSVCEELQCDTTVGYGGSPDENGETTLDAMIMDGETHSVGAVMCLRRIKSAISVARQVMERTKHTVLAGDLATEFAVKMGFKEESLTSQVSIKMHQEWLQRSCQPNFWRNVSPDPTMYCGPYAPTTTRVVLQNQMTSARIIDQFNHDTIGMVALDSKGRIASGTSSNGARNKIPGRVGDAPIVGAGSYVDKDVGGACATGDGDIMMRFLPSLVAVEQMRQGSSPTKAAEVAIAKISKFYPDFSGAVVALNIGGEYGAACHNITDGFPYSVRNVATGQVIVPHVQCI